ncbi:hypothetical protein KY332_01245 [Candidatus Woesearchaeota archaeon]|nr:hypothetical protein [Candidatus Woesearchaeota archaeon]
MSNILKIEGRKSCILNANLKPELGIYLIADYKGKKFDIRNIFGFMNDGEVVSAVLKFDPQDKDYEKNGLNHIILATDLNKVYRATGATEISLGEKPKFYSLGDDLEIIVNDSAREAVASIKDIGYEFQQETQGSDYIFDHDYFDLPGMEN